jgi:polysaccharide deacetylase family protein (PEP-CTERM system associated)
MSDLLGTPAKLVISIDMEDWPQSTWDRSLPISDRAERNAQRLLDILAENGKKATIFVLGKLAERFPAIVKRMVDEGHEIGSHGYGHEEIFHQTAETFREDVRRSKDILEGICGKAVVGFRAPDFSIVLTTTWALDILAELGFEYDSSIFPIKHRRYGIPDWPSHPVRLCLASGRDIVELPIATVSLVGRRLPIGGGGYHRLLPSSLILGAVSHVLKKGMPFIAYCHPYEFDPLELSSLEFAIPLETRLHQGLGRGGFRKKFKCLLDAFETAFAREIALNFAWPEHTVG